MRFLTAALTTALAATSALAQVPAGGEFRARRGEFQVNSSTAPRAGAPLVGTGRGGDFVARAWLEKEMAS